jgi:hypothetical protein
LNRRNGELARQVSQICSVRIHVLKLNFCGRNSETVSRLMTHNIFVDELRWSASAITEEPRKAFAASHQTSQSAETMSCLAETCNSGSTQQMSQICSVRIHVLKLKFCGRISETASRRVTHDTLCEPTSETASRLMIHNTGLTHRARAQLRKNHTKILRLRIRHRRAQKR